MQAHPEHEQRDADLRQLLGKVLVRNESRSKRPDHYAGDQVSEKRWEAETSGQKTKHECKPEPSGDDGDERCFVRDAS